MCKKIKAVTVVRLQRGKKKKDGVNRRNVVCTAVKTTVRESGGLRSPFASNLLLLSLFIYLFLKFAYTRARGRRSYRTSDRNTSVSSWDWERETASSQGHEERGTTSGCGFLFGGTSSALVTTTHTRQRRAAQNASKRHDDLNMGRLRTPHFKVFNE